VRKLLLVTHNWAGGNGRDAGFRHGAGRLSLDFIRTLRHRGNEHAVEELPDLTAVTAWVTQFGLCPAPLESPEPLKAGTDAPTPADTLARELREAVYQMITSARGPGGAASCPADARRTVNEAAAIPVPSPQMDRAGKLTWEANAPVQAALALIARDALELVTSEAITRVRDCANPGCRAMFLDSSRPGTRRWCSMNTCGNQAKKTTLRARHAAATGPA
jgi:predicted RNA-binding Zn ribbon-like protein